MCFTSCQSEGDFIYVNKSMQKKVSEPDSTCQYLTLIIPPLE